MSDQPATGGTPFSDLEWLRRLVASVTDYAIFVLDARGHVLTWNAGAQKLKQYRPDEIIGQHFSAFYTEEARASHHPDHELEIAAREGRYEEEGWRVRKDGSLFWANVVITALRDDHGALTGFAKVTRDLTDRRAADEKLRQSEVRLRLLIDSIRDHAIIMLDAEGHIATWNRGAEQLIGHTSSEIVGRHLASLYVDEDRQLGKADRALDIATATGRFEEEGWRVRKDGSRFWASVAIGAIRDGAGTLVGFAQVTRDLTERRVAEEERLRLAKAEEAVRLRDDFLSIASHELKTPLTTLQLQVSGLNRLLTRGSLDEEAQRRLGARAQLIERELDRLASLIEDLLDVSRAAAGKLPIEPTATDLGATVRDVAERLKEDLSRAGCELWLRIDEGVVGEWDPARLDQVVTNLLSNAMKYGGGKPIEVTVVRRASRAVLGVRDQGIGIEQADQTRIFERFTRAAPSSNYGGLGLGLWIVRLIVEALGGSVAVDSRPGHGATFIVSLPLSQEGRDQLH